VSTDVARLDLTEAKAFEIRRWAVGLRDQIQGITDPDTLAELSALLVGARHRLRQLKEEVVEAERTHVAVVRRLGELLGPATHAPGLSDEHAALPKQLRTTARAFADYPAVVEDGMNREKVSVSAIYRRIADLRASETMAEVAQRVSRDVTSLSVQPGQIWVLGDHRLYCGHASEDPFVAILRDTQPSLAYVDIPREVGPDMFWLAQYVDLFAAATEVDDMARVMSRVDKQYRWTLQFIHNTAEAMPVGQSHCWPLVLFADAAVKLDLTSDYHRVRDDISTYTDGRRPLSMFIKILEVLSNKDEVVVDPRAGIHGLTLMAAEKLGRRCVTADPDPLNCANIIARFNRDDSHPL
jgi:hypothetical protein